MSTIRKYLKYIALFTGFAPNILYSNDIEILIGPVNPYSFGSKDFGNIVVVNPGGEKNIQVKCIIKQWDGKVLMDAKSNSLLLKQGVNNFSSINLSYPSVNYSDNNIRTCDQRIKSLPAGSYEYCIEIYETVTNLLDAQECENIRIEILTPPITIAPENGVELEDIYPYFSWIPPIPTRANLKYRFTLVKVFEGQTAIDAILRNPPLHQTVSGNNFYQYPMSAVRLEKGGKYAWQVRAEMNETPTEQNSETTYKAESEVTDFTIKPDPKKPAALYPFAVINTFGEDKIYNTYDTLKIIYKEDYSSHTISYRIYNSQNETVVDKKESVAVNIGENLIQIPINTLSLTSNTIYWFELRNKNGQSFRLKFIKTKK